MQMTEKGIFLSLKPIMVMILLMTSLPITGCGRFSEFVLREGIAHLSFEYPVSFEKPYAQMIKEGALQCTAVDSRSIPRRKEEKPAEFSLLVSRPNLRYPDAKTALESFIKAAEEDQSYQAEDPEYGEFRLLERYPVTVAGVNGELIVLSCWWAATFWVRAEPELSAIVRIVYFDHSGLIWKIMFSSHVDRSEEDKANFEHMLKTFKVLD